MKKISLILMILLAPVLMFGCQKASSLKENMSEITNIYLIAQNDDVKANISVGEREEFYIVDGNKTKNVDFSLISIKFNKLLPENQIEVSLKVNDVYQNVLLELNPANNYYMADLGYALQESDMVSLSFKDFVLEFENVSKNFEVDANKALEIAERELGEKINKYFSGKEFKGEGYLKILVSQDDASGELFWVFTVVGENSLKNNVVINVYNGEVIVSD